MKKMLMIGSYVVLAAVAGSFGFLYFTKSDAVEEPGMAAAEPVAPPETLYYAITPEFIVNFKQQSGAQFLMLDVTVASTDAKVPEVLDTHLAEIRNDLLLLFSNHATADLFTDEGKAALRMGASESVTAVIQKHYEEGLIDDLFFTRFVMQ